MIVRLHRIVFNLFGMQSGSKADGSPAPPRSGRMGEAEDIDMSAIHELIRAQADRMNAPADSTDSGPQLEEARAKALQAQALKDMAAAQTEGNKSLTAIIAANQTFTTNLVGAMQQMSQNSADALKNSNNALLQLGGLIAKALGK
jgi:hypothetical protein